MGIGKDASAASANRLQQANAAGEIDLESLLQALVDEAVRSRLRYRALLTTLEQAGQLDVTQYRENYSIEEAQNFGVLLDMLLLKPDNFREKHRSWLESELDRLGYKPTLVQGVALSERSSSGNSSTPTGKKKRRAPKAKANARS